MAAARDEPQQAREVPGKRQEQPTSSQGGTRESQEEPAKSQRGTNEEPGSSQEVARATKEEEEEEEPGKAMEEPGEAGMSHLRPVLGPSWASWACLETIGLSWAILGLSWAILGLSQAGLGPFGTCETYLPYSLCLGSGPLSHMSALGTQS